MSKRAITLQSGFTFDYTNMMGEGRISEKDIKYFMPEIIDAAQAVDVMRSEGVAKAHLSKDGEPEPVYFTRLPDVKDGNPNNRVSMQKLKDFSKYLRSNVDAVVFLGIGGSYLGNKVLFDIGAGASWNAMGDKRRNGYPRVYFSGNNLDACQCEEIVNELRYWAIHAWPKKKRFKVMLVPISKSGSTLETVSAFIYFYEACTKSAMFDTEVTVVTDKDVEISPLYRLAEKHGWRSFDIKKGVGGRFSVLTDPGLVTAAAIGLDIKELLAGAAHMEEVCQTDNVYENPALMNATLKYLAGAKYGCHIEVFMGYGENLGSLSQWYVQLLAESLGKRHNRNGEIVHYGRTPVPAIGTTDMHAQTQLHQDGIRNKVVQFLKVDSLENKIVLGKPFPEEASFDKYDGLSLNEALLMALDSNAIALTSDNRFNACYSVPEINAFHLGELFYFLMLSVAYEGELANVDAFDQPGVETYKKIMKEKFAAKESSRRTGYV